MQLYRCIYFGIPQFINPEKRDYSRFSTHTDTKKGHDF